MKLRIRGNSVRIRIMQSELKQLMEQGAIEEHVHFPEGNVLTYRLKVDAAFRASFENNLIEVSIDESDADIWMRSDELSLKTTIDVTKSSQLSLLVEKDLACLTPREGEDDSDAFPNPNESC